MSNLNATAAGITKTEEIAADEIAARIAELDAEIDAIRTAGQILAKEVATGDATAIARFTVLAKMIERMEAEVAEMTVLQDDVKAYGTVTSFKF